MRSRAAVILLVLACVHCPDEAHEPVLIDVVLAPEGTVAACAPVTLHLTLGGLARYSVDADGETLSAGLLYAGEQRLELGRLPPPPAGRDRTSLTVTAVGESRRAERRSIVVPRSANASPHANAGPTRRAAVGDTIVLDARGSRDPDGDPLTFSWALVDGTATLQDDDAVQATVSLDEPGTAVVELTATDLEGAVGRARVAIRATDAGGPPAFVLPSDTVVYAAEPGETVTVDATATSPADAPVQYRWVQTAGPAAVLEADGPVARVTAPDSEGLVTIETVADNGFDEVRKRVSVLVGPHTLEDSPATPRVAAPSGAAVLADVTLDGSSSSDPEQSDLAFLWSVEEAPEGSRVSADSIAGNGTSAASQPVVTLDRAGAYRFRLRAIDAVGPSPAADELTVTATATVDVVDTGPVRAVALDTAGGFIASLAEGGALVVAQDEEPLLSAASGTAVFSPSMGVYYWARQRGEDPAEIVQVSTTTGEDLFAQTLPVDEDEDPPFDVRGIAVVPEGVNEGDLVLATNAGFLILDVSETSEDEPIGRPQQIIGDYVHRPPSFTPSDLPRAERDALEADQMARGASLGPIGARASPAAAIEVLAGNPFWLIGLDYPDNRSFFTRTVDPLLDDTPNAVLALGVGTTTELVMLEGVGLVWRGGAGGADCVLGPSDAGGCPAPAGDRCAEGVSDDPPIDASQIAVSATGRFWIASSDGVRRFDPDTGRFTWVRPLGDGPSSSVDVRGGIVATGTDEAVLTSAVDEAE